MHSQYRPDFSIYFEQGGVTKRIYLEHFGVDAVSYTHLDVYKRQVDEVLLNRREDSERLKNLSTTLSYKVEAKGKDRDEIAFFAKFVLDVYKRQVQG